MLYTWANQEEFLTTFSTSNPQDQEQNDKLDFNVKSYIPICIQSCSIDNDLSIFFHHKKSFLPLLYQIGEKIQL